MSRPLNSHDESGLQHFIYRGNVVAPMFDGFLGTRQLQRTDTLNLLNSLPECVERGVGWDDKEHNGDIQVDPDYTGTQGFHATSDVELVKAVCSYLFDNRRLACCDKRRVVPTAVTLDAKTFVLTRNDTDTSYRAQQRLIASMNCNSTN